MPAAAAEEESRGGAARVKDRRRAAPPCRQRDRSPARRPQPGSPPPYLPAAARSRGWSGRRQVPESDRPPPIQIPTFGADSQSARGRKARGANSQ